MEKRLSPKEKKLLIVGIIFMVLDIILLIDFYIVGTIMGISVLIVFVVGTVKRGDFIVTFSKAWIVLFCMFIILNPNPVHWGTQFQRRWMENRLDLIEPDHPSLPDTNSTFQSWFLSENGINFDDESDFETKVRGVDTYVREELFVYTLDQFNYGGYMDHIASMDEIITSKDGDGKYHDDCDGISVFTASFLIYLGFNNTYISEVTYHYHVMVYQDGINPKTESGYLSGITLYRGRVMAPPKPDKISYYMFNQTDIFIPPTRPLLGSVIEIFLDGNVWKYDISELFSGELLGLPSLIGSTASTIIMHTLLAIIMILASFGLLIYTQAGINEKLKSDMPKNAGKKNGLVMGLILFGTLFICNLLVFIEVRTGYALSMLCNPILCVTLIMILRFFESKFTK